ncbi:pyridoxal-dependent aspartate 1-decarboxylase PanP [Ketobacter alkanivorans]|uniref:Glutamate decarboxylase n=1 Tax=Ketobacter alkanivorans TaxID=1917421 RepID=A0A2K9LMY5_9GAMM|nr:putative pyridoxal-dependent aspartate 1-decarboxylase [Ketobacter alkanivorans]AUM12845.1 glutamate decarboxylase [Ketobacter alkanivorans]MCP5014533.1 putative pyridoxal-dependent aspartate 1-decarboxylase [Ketobacter sp.]
MTNKPRYADASMEAMYRIFTVPEAPGTTLGNIDQKLSQNLAGFLQEHIVAVEKDLTELQKDFSDSVIPEKPIFVSDQADFLMDKLVAQSVHTASPSFIGHMTSALPYFMMPLSRIMIALNQNLVKIETSKAFTPMERQVLGMIHRLIYKQDDGFYTKWMHQPGYSLGSFCSGGTIANMTALWVARNCRFDRDKKAGFAGIQRAGLFGALKHYGYSGAAILVSERGHYSLGKAADVLGIGRDSLISIKADARNKIQLDELRATVKQLKQDNVAIIGMVGVAGTSETGSVDPLDQMADIAEEAGCHFHVDAAWGGPTLFSDKYAHILKGIERADSVTIDAHKQMYVPMGAGMVIFKDPALVSSIEHHADYIIRKGSRDLGAYTLEGSRPGIAMLLHSGLKIIGRSGYEILIEQGIEKARTFADMIKAEQDFELITEPELNILTYRFVPQFVKDKLANASVEEIDQIHEVLNRLTKRIQKNQRARGKSFVSRTTLTPQEYDRRRTVVFRVVLANPLTSYDILQDVLAEQKEITASKACKECMAELHQLCESPQAVRAQAM